VYALHKFRIDEWRITLIKGLQQPGAFKVIQQKTQPVRSFHVAGLHLVFQTFRVRDQQHGSILVFSGHEQAGKRDYS
jgi:hypothetical protein